MTDRRRAATTALVVAVTAGTFALDLLTPLGYGVWAGYHFSLWACAHRPRGPFLLAAVSTGLIAAGALLSPPGIPVAVAIVDRALGAAVLWGTAFLLERRYRAEEARDAAERERGQALARVSDGVVALDATWHYTYLNERAAATFGRTPSDLIGKHIWTEFPDGVGQPFHFAYERAMRDQQPLTLEEYYPPYDRWFENRVYPSTDGLSIFFTDVTERHRAAAALRDERDFANGVLASLPGIVYCFDEQLRFRRWNQNLEQVSGYSASDIAAMQPLGFFAAADHPQVAARIQEVFERGSADIEADLLSKDGRRTPFLFTGLATVLGGQRHLLGVGVDLTERRRSETRLRISEERLRLALDAAQMGTFDWDIAEGRITWSRWHEELWGFAPGEFEGTYAAFASRIHPADLPALDAEVARCLADHTRFACEFRVVWPDGSIHWVTGNGEFAFDEQGRPLRMRGVVRDSTARREDENAIRALVSYLQTVREEERAAIARDLHDDLGQMLTGLKMDLSWLGRHGASVDKLDEMTGHVNHAIGLVQRLSSDLRPVVLDGLGLAAAIEGHVRTFERRHGIYCRTQLEEEPDLPSRTATAVFRILQEALTNVARHAGATEVEVRLGTERARLRLVVRDNGRGATSDQASGRQSLGLLGMRERAADIGGQLTVSGAPGAGTTVDLMVPIA
jgi:PAS domain S-box-containing protein